MTHTAGSDRARSVAIRLLQWYPRPWRRRYLVEMQALLQQMPVRWWQVANLAVMGVREWMSPRAVGWPARSAAGRVNTRRAFAYVICAYAIDGIARVLARQMQANGIVISDSVSTAVAMTMCGTVIYFIAASVRYDRHVKRFPKAPEIQRPGRLRGWHIALWACLLFPYLVVRHAEPIPTYLSQAMVKVRPYVDVIQVYVWAFMAIMSSASTKRLIRVQNSMARRQQRYPPPTSIIN
jgi:hypothetical protein